MWFQFPARNVSILRASQYKLGAVGPTVLAGMVLHPLEKAKAVLKFYREYTSTAPEEISAWAALLTAPDGNPMVAVLACDFGPNENREKVLQALKEFGPPVMEVIQPMPYVQSQSLIDESFVDSKRVEASVRSEPKSIPRIAGARPALIASSVTSRGRAPTATRMPISVFL